MKLLIFCFYGIFRISKAPEEDSNIIAANKMSSSQKVDKPVDANETGSGKNLRIFLCLLF